MSLLGGHLDDSLAQMGAIECSGISSNEILAYMWLQFPLNAFLIEIIHVMISSDFYSVNLATCIDWSHNGSQFYALAKICTLRKRKSKGHKEDGTLVQAIRHVRDERK